MIGFKTTDWIFFFNEEQSNNINKVANNPKFKSDFKTWIIISVALPFLTYLFAAFINFLLGNGLCTFMDNWHKILINGSLPIISFGIISSGVPFLMDEVTGANSPYQKIRKRVMSVALLFLFLTSGLYILQTLEIVVDNLSQAASIIIFFFSIYITAFSISVGFKMYLLQGSILSNIGETIVDNRNDLIQGLQSQYGNNE
jgi:hypothetical protein